MKPKKKKTHVAHRFTWFDGAIVLILLAGLVVFGWYAVRARREIILNTDVSYTLCMRGVLKERMESGIPIHVGGRVTSSNGTTALGAVEEVTLTPHRRFGVGENGAVLVEDPFRMDINVRIRASGRLNSGDGFRVSDVRVAVGMLGDFRIDGYLGAAEVISITLLEEDT